MGSTYNSQGKLPLTEPMYFTLLSIASKPKHGYAILREVEQISQGQVRLSTGTLYGCLRRLLDMGWIERVSEDSPSIRGKPRKDYRVTKKGQHGLRTHVARLKDWVEIAQQLTLQRGL